MPLSRRRPFPPAPLLPVALSLIAGTIAARIACGYFQVESIVVAVIAVIITVAIIILRRPFSFVDSTIILAAALIGFINLSARRPASPATGDYSNLQAIVIDIDQTDLPLRLVVEVTHADGGKVAPFSTILYIPAEIHGISAGDIISFSAGFKPLHTRLLLPDETDYDNYIEAKGIVGRMMADPESVTILGPGGGILNAARRWKAHLVNRILQLPVESSTRHFLVATLTGDSSLIDDSTRLNLSKAGVAHVLALSGLHVAIIALIISVALFPLWVVGARRSRWIIAIILLWGFAALTGFGHSVTRSVVMASVLLLGSCMERPATPLNSLAFAAIVIVIFDPLSLWSPGFCMSFMAVLSILIFTPVFLSFSRREHPVAYKLLALPATTVAATIGTSAIAACYFNFFPVFFIASNLVVGLLLPFIIGGGIILLLCSALSVKATLIAVVVDFMMSVIDRVSALFTGIDFSTIWIFPGIASVVFYYLAAACFAAWFYSHRRVWGLTGAVVLLATVAIYFFEQPVYPEAEYFISGDHKSTFILSRERDRAVIYTDANELDASLLADNVMQRCNSYLRRNGVDSIVARSFPSRLLLGHDTVCIVDSVLPMPAVDSHTVILLTRTFRGDVLDAACLDPSGMIVVSSAINKRRAARYIRELLSLNLRAVNLRDTIISAGYSSNAPLASSSR